jgi:small subunit ribosomal protein S1
MSGESTMDTMENGGDFAALFESSFSENEKLEPGQQVEAEIVRISKEWIFLDLGGKSEGALATSELLGDDGTISVKEGDTVAAYYLANEQGQKLFTIKIGGAAATAHMENAFNSGIPVEGEIKSEIKGGFEVRIGESVRGFCPYSQVALRRVTDAESLIGQTFNFRIIEFKESGRNIILSRRSILEEEQQELKEKLKDVLDVGQVVTGEVTSIRDFGAFVDIGGVEGLLPISEMSYTRIKDVRSILEEGQKVEVSILKLDWEHDRFSFSLKDTLDDPWETIDSLLIEGSCVTGVVARITDFGAFVTVAPGIDGLLHISNLGAGRRINHPREVVADGEELEVRIDGIDVENKRISLSLPHVEKKKQDILAKKRSATQKEPDLRQEFKEYSKGKKQKSSSPMGTFADLLKGADGK